MSCKRIAFLGMGIIAVYVGTIVYTVASVFYPFSHPVTAQ